ncbi:hypothetical protein [Candidatus Nitronereus thalassa]|uniref:Uncharacterized protein n=1 Tax=Candidatus Nitronereus thalassa TaxID=3020898 RepID=A0ABU3KBZ3_9BACT|nr:hypothetical protein [Candidatus Nitronereus thalassa]MDT7043908.1 hypothetical protein [Candidatus Nitronereus thalassa]
MKAWVGLSLFVVGVGTGAVGTQFIPPTFSSYMPVALQAQSEIVKGTVVRKHQDKERLLLTVSTSRGALLGTFTRQIPEINLLVEEGDEITLGLAQYAPFVHDPSIRGVMKPDHFGEHLKEDLMPDEGDSLPLDSPSTTQPLRSGSDAVDPQT